MTNRKTTKRALLGSVLALVLCFAMLLGSTYAWFTDTTSASVDVIKAGTLDIDLYVRDDVNGTTWTEPTANTMLFTAPEADWEPGYRSVEILKVVNNGSLDLQWEARIDTTGVAFTALADVIDVYAIPLTVANAESVDFASLDLANFANYKAGTLAQYVAGINNHDVDPTAEENVLENGEDTAMVLILAMQTTAGNEYQGMSLLADGSAPLAITIVATQVASETDSINNQYDNIDIDRFDVFQVSPKN